MNAFDSDVFTEILAGNVEYSRRAELIPISEQAVPIIVIEEILRGRLNAIRQAEAGKSRLSVERAYEHFEETLIAFREVRILRYVSGADVLYHQWRRQKIRVGTHDLRIAAICVAQAAKLITRNRRDFDRVPGLLLEVWP